MVTEKLELAAKLLHVAKQNLTGDANTIDRVGVQLMIEQAENFVREVMNAQR